MLLGHYIIISIFLGRRPNVQDFNVSKQPCIPTGQCGGGEGPRAFRYERARESPIWLLPASGLIQKYSPRLVP